MKEKIVAFLPIRLNSQRIKNKSIIDIFGRPMFCWSLETLDKLNIPTYVYSSDIEELKNLCDFQTKNINWLERPKFLDSHETKGIEIYREFAKTIDSQAYLLCHCTSPFLKLKSYQNCIDAVLHESHDSSLTVKREQTFCWYKQQPINFSLPRQKTQNIEPIFVETSAAYCFKKEILKTGSRTGSNIKLIETHGLETLDIDNEDDMEFLRREV